MKKNSTYLLIGLLFAILPITMLACSSSGGGTPETTTTISSSTTITATTTTSSTTTTLHSGVIILSRDPGTFAEHIICSTPITVVFSGDLDSSSVNTSTFLLNIAGGSAISGTVSYSNKVATFEPATILTYNSTYEISLQGVKDTDEITLETSTWSFTTGRVLRSFYKGEGHYYHNPPTLYNNYLYVGTDNTLVNTHNCYFFKLDTTLTKIWEYSLGTNPVAGAGVVDINNNVYFIYNKANEYGGNTAYLCTLDQNGIFRWEKELGTPTGFGMMTPALSADKLVVYAGAWGRGNYLYAFSCDSTDGTPLWTYAQGGMVPVIDNNGRIYVTAKNADDYEVVHCVSSSGSLEWISDQLSFEVTYSGPELVNSPVFSKDWTHLYVTDGPTLNCINTTTGTLEWSFAIDLIAGDDIRIRCSPAVDEEGNIFFGTKSTSNTTGSMYALNPNGTLKWHNTTNTHDHYSSPAIGNDGVLYQGTEGMVFEAIHKDDGTYHWSTTTPSGMGGDITWSSPAIDSNGIAYVGNIWGTNPSGEAAYGGYLFAIQTDSTGLKTDCGSPKYHGGNANTGRRYDE